VPLTTPFTITSSCLETISNIAVHVQICSGVVGQGEVDLHLPPGSCED
jgi:hypothetical protein